MKEQEMLQQFQKILADEEYDCSLVKATDEIPYDRLLVFLGVDEKERERILEISSLKQEIMHGFDLGSAKSMEGDIFRIQFLVKFPFSVKPEAGSQLSSLICYLNRVIELPGFEMNEIDLQVFYRYVLMYGEEKFNKKLFVSIVGIIMLLNELFSSTLDNVATGETTFNELLEKIVSISGS